MDSIKEEYRSRHLYKHPTTVAARTSAQPTSAANELAATRSRHQIEASKFREEALNERRKLENSQKLRRSRSPHTSYDQKDHLESVALDKRLKERGSALRARHERELDAAKQRSMPR
jgi:hypothetical protein